MTSVEDMDTGWEGFSGELLRPGDEGYEDARRPQRDDR